MAEDPIKPVRLVFEQGEAVEALPESQVLPPPEDEGGGGGPGGPRGEGGLPELCPVVPLGIAGEWLYFMDDSRQVREIKHKDMSRLNVAGLFGRRIPWLYNTWSRVDKDGNKLWQNYRIHPIKDDPKAALWYTIGDVEKHKAQKIDYLVGQERSKPFGV